MRDMETKTALVVEDNSGHYKRYAALLSGMGLRVERACDGIDALAMAKAGRYAVVILDMNLPRLGGLFLGKGRLGTPRHVEEKGGRAGGGKTELSCGVYGARRLSRHGRAYI